MDNNAHIIDIDEVSSKVGGGWTVTVSSPLSPLFSKNNRVLCVGHQALKFEPKTAGIKDLLLL